MVIMNGWPSELKEAPEVLKLYWIFRDAISVYDGVLYRSHQEIVPATVRDEMLQKIHKAHQGADSSIRRTRESLFWPGMQAAIREKYLLCGLCAQYLSERPREQMKSHEIPTRPWSKISAALFHLDGSNYLVMVNHYSYFFEVDPLGGNTSANAVIRSMKRQFARYGDPDECISDNGTQFESHEYSRFAREYGFIVRKSSSNHSRGNGKAESAVKIAPHTVSPSLVQENISERRRKSKAQYDKRVSAPLAEFSEGDKVYVKPRPTKKHQPWIYGEVIVRPAPRSCLVSTAMGPVRREHAQIREAKAEPVDNYDGRLDRFETASLPSESGPIEKTDQPVEQEPTPPPRRSTRERRLPSRFNDFLME